MSQVRVFLDSANICCRTNALLSSKVHSYLVANHHLIVDNPSQADYVILNSCGYTLDGTAITTDLYEEYLNNGGGYKIISVGCLNKIDPETCSVYQDIIFVPTLEALDEYFKEETAFREVKEAYLDENKINVLTKNEHRQRNFLVMITESIVRLLLYLIKPIVKKESIIEKVLGEIRLMKGEKIYVEIGQGCVGNCGYCAIKRAKGSPCSRPVQEILEDIDRIYEKGKILYFVADDSGSYGIDRGTNFPELLREIHKRYPDLLFDIVHLNPIWLERDTENYCKLMKDVNIHSLNIPIQSGSDRITRLMDRPYSIDRVKNIIQELKAISPETLIWTHIIVGLPTETEQDFQDSIKAMEVFDTAKIFTYCDAKDTKASKMEKDKVSSWMKRYRWLRLYVRLNLKIGKYVLNEIRQGLAKENPSTTF